MDNNQLSGINRYTFKFENSVMEDKFMSKEYSKVKKGKPFGIEWQNFSLI